MPFKSSAAMVGGDLAESVRGDIMGFLKKIDDHVARICEKRGLFPSQIRLLQPLNFCVIATDKEIFVIATNLNAGGMPRQQFVDWTGREMSLQVALRLVRRDLAFEEPFGFQFERSILGRSAEDQTVQASSLAELYIRDEILNLERLQRVVRINPIFQGRDFLMNDELVFMLAPFEEPFDTIYNDHLKPTIEHMDFSCMRADNIYDNRPIIEDIWRYINEARIVVAELTGRNPNVFYEVGIAHTVGKEVILLTQTMEDVPFDLRHLRCIVYDYTPRGVQTLETNLRNTIGGILRRE